jgi:hypothetical protein
VKETPNAARAVDEKRTRTPFGGGGWGVGNTLAKRRKEMGISAAEANASRPHTSPQVVPGYTETRPLLSVHAATEKEKIAK